VGTPVLYDLSPLFVLRYTANPHGLFWGGRGGNVTHCALLILCLVEIAIIGRAADVTKILESIMKTKLFIVLTAVALLMGCKEETVKEPEPEIVLDTVEKKMSYMVGYNTARQTKAMGLDLDADIVMSALKDAQTEAEPKLTEEEMRAVVTTFQTEQQAKKQEEVNQLMAKNLEAGKTFLEENAKKEGVVQTESGLQYQILQAGEGDSPKAEDMVLVNYRGTHLNGDEFDASEKHGGPVKFPVGGLIPGWVEGLQLMNKGAKWKMFIPGDLAYGSGGKMNMRTGEYDIEPNELLIFELELVDINPPEEAKEEPAKEAPKEEKAE